MSMDSLTDRVAESLKVETFRSGLTQQKIADAIGASPAWVQRRFSGHVDMTLRDLTRIADAAGLDVDVNLARRSEVTS